MESKHTPGPWRIDNRQFKDFGMMHITCGSYIVAHALGETHSCELEANANARLIAAAPELLAAVDALYQRLPDELARDMGWVESLLDRCGKPYRAEGR